MDQRVRRILLREWAFAMLWRWRRIEQIQQFADPKTRARHLAEHLGESQRTRGAAVPCVRRRIRCRGRIETSQARKRIEVLRHVLSEFAGPGTSVALACVSADALHAAVYCPIPFP